MNEFPWPYNFNKDEQLLNIFSFLFLGARVGQQTSHLHRNMTAVTLRILADLMVFLIQLFVKMNYN